LTSSDKFFSEACQKIAPTLPENDAIVLSNLGQLALEDKDFFVGLSSKLEKKTGLPKSIIIESLKHIRQNKSLLDKLKIQTIAEETED
jgi:hypothetical protein